MKGLVNWVRSASFARREGLPGTPPSTPSVTWPSRCAPQAPSAIATSQAPRIHQGWRTTAPPSHGPVTPNHLTTVRLGVGVAAAAAFMHGGYAWMNLGALLLVISNFLDHTDGELARLSGRTSRLGHWYDLGSDAL